MFVSSFYMAKPRRKYGRINKETAGGLSMIVKIIKSRAMFDDNQ